mgnify:CR=1 FL=1
MILTKQFLLNQNACEEGIQFAFDNFLIDKDYSEVIRDTVSLGQRDFAGWLLEQKNTEAYVCANGKEITMGESYQVFNPMTGLHEVAADIESAKVLVAEIQKQILTQHSISVCRELKNENGDAVWIPVEFPYEVSVTVTLPQA